MQAHEASPEFKALAAATARAASEVNRAFKEQVVPAALKAIEDFQGMLAPPGSAERKAFLVRRAQAASRAQQAQEELTAFLERTERPARRVASSATP